MSVRGLVGFGDFDWVSLVVDSRRRFLVSIVTGGI